MDECVKKLEQKIKRQREIIEEMQARPVSAWVSEDSRGESIFRAHQVELDLIGVRNKMVIVGHMVR